MGQNKDAQRMDAEQRYITGDMSLQALAQEIGVGQTTICRWSTEGKWAQKRRKYREKTLKKAVTRAGNKKADKLARMLEASDGLEKALIQATEILEKEIGDYAGGLLVGGKFAARNLESMAKALNAAAQTRMLISGIMTAAEKERAEQARRQLEQEDKGAEIHVVVAPEAEEISQ